MVADQRDVVEHVEGTVRLAVLVQPDQRPGDVEGDPHGLVALVGDQRVRLAGRLVDPVARGGDPVVLQVAPLAGDRVGEHLLRVVVPVDQAGAAAHQHVAPPVLAGGDPQRPGADGLGQRGVEAVVLGGGVGDVRLRQRAGPELLLDRLELPPEFAVRHESSSASASSAPPGDGKARQPRLSRTTFPPAPRCAPVTGSHITACRRPPGAAGSYLCQGIPRCEPRKSPSRSRT